MKGLLARLPWTRDARSLPWSAEARLHRRLRRLGRRWDGVPYRWGMGRDDDRVLVQLSPGRSTRRRPGETWSQAMDRLMEGEDL